MTTVIEFLTEDSNDEVHPTVSGHGSVPIPLVGDYVAHSRLYKVTKRTFSYDSGDTPEDVTVKASLRCEKISIEELTPPELAFFTSQSENELARREALAVVEPEA